MEAKELLDAGHLVAAIEQLGQEVKVHPTDTQRRTFLFELLCFAGEYDRARRQLDVLGHESTSREVGVQAYRNVLAAEEARRALFAQGVRPEFVETPPAYTRLHLEAVNRLRENRPGEARSSLDESARVRPVLQGRLDGQEFDGFRDADDVIGPFLEVFIHNRYTWFPFEALRRIEISAPRRLRDLLWVPATLESWNGSVGEAFLPVLYAGSSDHPDEQVRLGRMTDWKPAVDGLTLGAGQRIFLVSDEERSMLEVRTVEFARVADSG
jgi:type VI secretion system protein ImpE